jgi:hypothetical protein
LRTNLQVYWDEVALSPLVEKPSAIPVPLREAVLGRRGVLRELTDGDGQPQRYDPERTEAVPVTRWRGPRTRFGDVTPLAKSADDQLVLCGPGEAVTLVFNGTGLPPVRAGWQRSFVLRATGYCKDTAPFTATGGSTLPLPFRGMSRYPYGPEEQPAANAAHGDQAVRWHTR